MCCQQISRKQCERCCLYTLYVCLVGITLCGLPGLLAILIILVGATESDANETTTSTAHNTTTSAAYEWLALLLPVVGLCTCCFVCAALPSLSIWVWINCNRKRWCGRMRNRHVSAKAQPRIQARQSEKKTAQKAPLMAHAVVMRHRTTQSPTKTYKQSTSYTIAAPSPMSRALHCPAPP